MVMTSQLNDTFPGSLLGPQRWRNHIKRAALSREYGPIPRQGHPYRDLRHPSWRAWGITVNNPHRGHPKRKGHNVGVDTLEVAAERNCVVQRRGDFVHVIQQLDHPGLQCLREGSERAWEGKTEHGIPSKGINRQHAKEHPRRRRQRSRRHSADKWGQRKRVRRGGSRSIGTPAP